MADESQLPPGYEILAAEPPPIDAMPQGYTLAAKPEKKRALNLDLAEEIVSNALPSAAKQIGQFVSGVGDAISDPVGTAKQVGKLVVSAADTAYGRPLLTLAKVLQPHLTPEQSKDLAKTLIDLHGPSNALMKDYAEHYGGWDNILKTAATDPFRIVTDLGMLAAPAAGAPGRVGQAARAVVAADPVTVSMRAAGAGARAIPRVLDVTTNTGTGVMGEAARAGFTGGNIARDFRDARAGRMPMEELVERADNMYNTWRNDMMADFRTSKSVWNRNAQPQQISFADIDRTANDITRDLTSQGTGLAKYSNADQARIGELLDIVDQWQRSPAGHTLEGLDDLKQRLRNEVNWRSDSDHVARMATRLTNSVRDTIVRNAPPEYRAAMRAYTETSRELDNVRRALGVGERGGTANVQTALSKLQSVMRDGANTAYGHRRNTLRRLEEESGQNIMAALAGTAVNTDMPRGITRGVMTGSVPAGLAALTTGGMGLLPLAAGAAGVAAASPRLMSGAMYAAGAAGRPFARVYNRMSPAARSVVRAPITNPGINAFRQVDRSDEDGGFTFARGGRAFARYGR